MAKKDKKEEMLDFGRLGKWSKATLLEHKSLVCPVFDYLGNLLDGDYYVVKMIEDIYSSLNTNMENPNKRIIRKIETRILGIKIKTTYEIPAYSELVGEIQRYEAWVKNKKSLRDELDNYRNQLKIIIGGYRVEEAKKRIYKPKKKKVV